MDEILLGDIIKFNNRYEIKQSGCWEWTGYRLPKGYGYMNIGKKSTGAHRVSYMIHKGEIPNGMHVHHICENTCCVNPEHLTILTPEANLKLNSSPIAINSRKEFCKRGHEFNEDNTRYTKRNGKIHRRCRECHNESCKQKRHRDKTDHSRIVEALKAENEQLSNKYTSIGVTLAARNSEIAELKTWQNGARQAKAELDLERIRLQDIIRDLEAKLDKAKWQPIETAPKDGRPILVSITSPKSGDSWQDVVCFNDIENQFMSGSMFIGHDFITHWMPLPDAPVKL